MNLNIYRGSLSSVIASTSAFEVNRTLMEVRKITCSMKSVVPIEWAPYNGGTYDFVMYNDEKYILYAKPTSEDRNEVSKLTYKLIFSGQEILLQNAPFLDVVTGTGSSIDEYRYTNGSIVNFFGDIRQFVLRLNANITYFNNHGGDLAGWTVELDLSPEYDYREFNVSSANSSLLDALSIINSAYSLKYYFNTTGTNKKVIITDKVRNTIDYVFEQGEDKGLYNISATVSADKDVVTRLRPLGGSRNIPTDYKNDAKPIDNTRYCPNLMLPNDANGNIVYTIDSASGIQKYGVREKSVTQEFEGIYPSIRNVSLQDVYGTSSLPATGNDGVKLTGLTASQRVDQLIGASKVLNEQQSYFYVYLTDIGFYLDKTNEDGIYVYATTNEAVISMRTGLYTGVEFTIVKGKTKQLTGAVQEDPDMDIAQTADDVAMYNAGARYRVKLIRTEDNGAKFPSVNTSVPALSAGSEFVILNIFMPPVYVTMAENKLKQAAIEFLSIYDHSLYTIGLNIATGFTIEHPEIFLNQFLEGAKLKVKSNKIGVLNDSGGPVEINIQSVTISYSENTLFPTYNCTLAEIKKQTIFEQLSSEIRNVSASQTSLQSAGLSASAVSDILQRLQIIDNMFEWDKERTAIKAKYNFYGIGEITAYGYGTEIPWTTSLGNLTNVVNNADDVAGVDYILYKPKGASTWALKDASDIGGQGKIYYAGSGISLTDSNGDTANTINVRFGQGAGLVMEGSDSRVLTAINDIANIKKTTFWGQTMINNKVEGALVNTGNITPSATNVSTVGTMDLVYKVMYATSFVGALLGNATSSSMWDSAITLIAGGDASGSTEIRGDANATLTLSVNKLHTARSLWGQSFNGTANVSGAISSTGHITPSSTGVSDIGSTTFKYRNIYGNLVGNVSGNVSGTLTGNVTGNVSGSAGSLATTRTIWGQNFNGTQNVLGEMSGVSIINKVLFFNGTNVGINHATPNVALHVSGTIKSTGEVVAYATSDYDPSQDIPKASKTSYGWVKIGDNINVVDGVISAAKQGMDEVALAAYLSSNGYINSTNYTNYTVTKTGGGASGTWAIGISGNAATASSAAKLTTARNIALSGAVNGSANFDGSSNITIATSFAQNFDSKYVLKAGDTMSGNLILNDSAATGSRMLKFTGYTDYAHIKFSAASSDNSFLEIATGDNGNTPIYIRQYNTSGIVTHETVLMDGNGATIFEYHVISNIAPFSRRMRSDSSNAEYGFQFISQVSVSQLAWIGYHNTGQNLWLSPQPAELEWWLASKKGLRIGTTSMGFNGNTVWHAGNDGAGSGLDADLLDGKQGNAYMSFQRLNINANNYTSIGVWESNTSTNMPTLNNWHQVMNWGTSDSNYAFQMSNSYTTDYYLSFRYKIAGSWKDWRTIIDRHIIGYKNDYQHVVILLWRDKEESIHQVIGRIYTANGGSARFQLADVNLWHSRWGSLDNQENTQCQIDTTGYPLVGFTLVTCTYRGETWWALKHTNNQAVYFLFQGYSSQNISFEKVVYYTSNTSTVNNSEIYNSIVDRSNDIYGRYTAGYAYMLSRDVYQKSESDARYVNVTGDTMTGRLELKDGLNTADIEIKATYPYIDFHYNNSSADYTSRIVENASGRLSISGKLAVGTTGAVNDSYALSATSFYSSGNIVSTSRIYTGYDPGSGYNNSISCSNWFRSNGSTGWYNGTYKGGIFMNDTEYVKVYGGKSFWASGKIECNTYFDRKIYAGASWYNGHGAYNVAISNNSAQTPIIVAYRSGYSADVTGANRLFSFELLNTGSQIYWAFGGESRFKFYSSGNFIATGNIVANGEVTAYSASDIRLKTHIRPISNPFNVLKRVRPVLFKWNKTAFDLNEERPEGDVPGMIAQWEQSVLPVAIHSVYDKYLGIKYENYIPYLIAGANEHEIKIQQLQREIEELKRKVKELNSI